MTKSAVGRKIIREQKYSGKHRNIEMCARQNQKEAQQRDQNRKRIFAELSRIHEIRQNKKSAQRCGNTN